MFITESCFTLMSFLQIPVFGGGLPCVSFALFVVIMETENIFDQVSFA